MIDAKNFQSEQELEEVLRRKLAESMEFKCGYCLFTCPYDRDVVQAHFETHGMRVQR